MNHANLAWYSCINVSILSSKQSNYVKAQTNIVVTKDIKYNHACAQSLEI